MLDDPTSSLDTKSAYKVFEALLTHQKLEAKTIIVATKKAEVLEKFDKVIFMIEGKVEYFGKLDQLLKKERFNLFLEQANSTKREPEKPIEELNALIDLSQKNQVSSPRSSFSLSIFFGNQEC